jgi:hypothetical protein
LHARNALNAVGPELLVCLPFKEAIRPRDERRAFAKVVTLFMNVYYKAGDRI